MIPTIKYHQWLDVAGVYLIDNGMTIGNNALLAMQAEQAATPTMRIDADQVSIVFTSITTLRVIWHNGKPIEKGSLIYNGAFLIVEKC